MRILHVVFTRGLFGSERYAADLARLQVGQGHEVHIAVDPRAKLRTILAPGITVHRVPRIFRTFWLKRLLRRLQPDVAHAHLSAACKALGRIQRDDRPPAIATMHVGYKPQQHQRLDGLIALTDQALQQAKAFARPVTLIGNWAPPMPKARPEGRAAIRRGFGIAPETFVIGFIGRLHPSKNPQLLVKAYRAAKLHHAALLIVGEGPERAELERLCVGDASIWLLGYRNDAAQLYGAFDLFVMPSRFEQMPLALLEAMTADVPIAASAIDSIAGFLPAPPAILFPPGDAAALTRILGSEYAHGPRRQTYDLTPFDPERQAAKIIAFYRHVMEQRKLR